MDRQDDLGTLSFEEAFSELEQTVQKLEEGELTLEAAIALFERGGLLVQFCNGLLDRAELKVRQLLPSGEMTDEGDEGLFDQE
jgi:exodeoxyribonuclease VII small subunit